MFKKWLSRIFITILLILSIGGIFLAYCIFSSKASSEPESVEIKPVFVKKYDLEMENERELRQRIEEKNSALVNQLFRLENQEKALQDKKEKIEANIERELKKIKDKYQIRVDNEGQIRKEEFITYQEKKEQEYREKVLVKKELLETKLKDLESQLKIEKSEELEVFKREIRDKYYPDILNINLKLKVLNLTKEEKANYEQSLVNLKEDQSKEFENKKEVLEDELKNKINDLKDDFNEEFIFYQQGLETKFEDDLKNKKIEDEKELQRYISEQQGLLNGELRSKRQELRDRIQDELIRLEELIREIKREYYHLQSELAILQKEVME